MKYFGLMALLVGALLIMACGDGAAHYPDNDGIPNNCEYTNGKYYQKNHFARFDNNHRQLAVVDWNTGETLSVVAKDIDAANTAVLEWSPSCQYLVTYQDYAAVFYDMVNERQLASFPDSPGYDRYNPSIVFDQNNHYVTVESDNATYIYNIQTGNSAKLADHYFTKEYFDYDRNQLVIIDDLEEAIYDLDSGAKLISFGDLKLWGDPGMVFSPDHNLLAFYADQQHTLIFNRNTMQQVKLNTNFYYVAGEIHMAISDDNRWLAIGNQRVNVWDLQNPKADLPSRTPPTFNFDGPDGRISALKFGDGNVIEAVTDDGTTYWDMTTGEQVKT